MAATPATTGHARTEDLRVRRTVRASTPGPPFVDRTTDDAERR
jgi:hypothetical protein